jgi:hypothetical protein|tara:strand:- start:2655 stop:2966 length:312 start_codon:yes stop_codon:yes gene_type:complete
MPPDYNTKWVYRNYATEQDELYGIDSDPASKKRVKVYAKILRLRQRIYNWDMQYDLTGDYDTVQWEKDLKFVDNQQENMDDDEIYYPQSGTLRKMNDLWVEYK